MAQFRTDTDRYLNNCNTIFEVVQVSTRNGQPVSNSNPFPVTMAMGSSNTNPITITGEIDVGAAAKTAFGELLVVNPFPVVQLNATFGLDPFDFTTYNLGTGSSANTDSTQLLFEVQSGTSNTGDAHILSRKFMKYRPGQGSLSRFTAAFTAGVNNSIQLAGLLDTETNLAIGYNGTRFGVVRTTGGRVTIKKLTINVAPNAGQTATITLNGVPFTVSLVSGTAIDACILIQNRSGGYTLWETEQVDNTVIFRAIDTGVMSGTFSFSSTGNATGTFTTVQTGVIQNYNWTYQEDFSEDTLDGSGNSSNPSKMHLRPNYLNVYQIMMKWLGAGMIQFGIEDEATGKVIIFHKVHYTNQHSYPHLDNPSFRIGYSVTNTGSTTNSIVTGASMMMAIEGMINATRATRSYAAIKSSITKDIITHIFSIRNSQTYNNRLNTCSINLMKISFAFQSTDPVDIYIFQNPSSGTAIQFNDLPNSIATASTTSSTFSSVSETPIAIFATGVNGSATIDIQDLLISEPPGSILSFAVLSSSPIARATVSAIWAED